MLRILVVITIGLLLSGCALDAMGRGSPSGSSPQPKTKIIKQAPVVPVPFGEQKKVTPVKAVAAKTEKKEKKKRSWLFW